MGEAGRGFTAEGACRVKGEGAGNECKSKETTVTSRETHNLELIRQSARAASPTPPRKRRTMQHSSDSPTAVRLKQQLSQVLDLGDEQLRGVPIPTLLSGGAQLFAEGGAAARDRPKETFALSKPVRRVDYFISHAWRSSRLTKYLALCRFFNLSSAMIVAVVCNLALFIYTLHFSASDVQDVRRDFVDGTQHFVPRFYLYTSASAPIFLILCAALLQHVLHRGATGFLDIACVPQDDEVGKAQGITRLGAILARSERMILLVDEHYWRRLWCIFEVAAFCRHAERDRLVVLPLHVATVELAWLVNATLAISSGVLASTAEIEADRVLHQILFIAPHILAAPVAIFAQVQGRRSREALRALRDFSIDDAQCHSAEDRKALITVISEWYTDTRAGETDPERLLELGKRKFELFVRHDLAPLIERQESNKKWKGFFFVMMQSASLVSIVAPTITLHQAAMSVVTWGLYMPLISGPLIIGGVELGAAIVTFLTDRVVPRLSSPRTLLRYALTATVYLFGMLGSASCVVVGMLTRWILVTPNQLLFPEWKFPDDGLDANTRRLAKQWLVLIWHLVALGVGVLVAAVK